MAFRTPEFPKKDSGKIKQGARKAAVKCWFTAGGRAMPLSLKLQEEDGEILETDRIFVMSCEKKFYAGIPSLEYRCRIVLSGKETEAVLSFCPESCSWKLAV